MNELKEEIIPYAGFWPINVDAKKMSGEDNFYEKTIEYSSILEKFSSEDRSVFFSEEYFNRFVKKGKELCFEDYSIERGRKQHQYYYDCAGVETHSIYCDVPYQFFLSCNGEFIANLGFESVKDGILVSQIQGVRGQREYLKDLKWAHFLLNISEEWARNSGISQMYVLPKDRNRWNNVRHSDSSGKFYYDVTAKRNGFVYDKNKKVYVKSLEVKK